MGAETLSRVATLHESTTCNTIRERSSGCALLRLGMSILVQQARCEAFPMSVHVRVCHEVFFLVLNYELVLEKHNAAQHSQSSDSRCVLHAPPTYTPVCSQANLRE